MKRFLALFAVLMLLPAVLPLQSLAPGTIWGPHSVALSEEEGKDEGE